MTTNLKLILAAALAFAPLPAFAQSNSDQTIRNGWASFYCTRQARLCPLTHRALRGGVTVAELRQIERRVCTYGMRDTEPCRETTPPAGWDRGNSFAKDACTERDDLASDRACYAAYLRQRALDREEDRAAAHPTAPRP